MWEAGRTIFEYLEAINEQELSGGKSTERNFPPRAACRGQLQAAKSCWETAQALGISCGFQP